MKQYLDATLKSISNSGVFTAVASAPTVDRDGEVIITGAFDPLPKTIQVHAFHNFADPVGQARPRYEGDQLLVDGWFGTTPRAQEVRQMAIDGLLPYVSVGFRGSQREERNGIPHILSAELLEVSLVSVPSNREAAVLSVRGYGSGKLTELDRWRARIAVLEAEMALLTIDGGRAQPAPEPTDIRQVLADAKSFLSGLSRPAGATPAPPTTKALKARPREAKCLFDVMANRNAESFDDQPVVEDKPSPPPYQRYTASAYDTAPTRNY